MTDRAPREGQQLGNYRLMHLPAQLTPLIGREPRWQQCVPSYDGQGCAW